MRFVPAAKKREGLPPLGISESGIGTPAAVNDSSAPAVFHVQRRVDDQEAVVMLSNNRREAEGEVGKALDGFATRVAPLSSSSFYPVATRSKRTSCNPAANSVRNLSSVAA